MLISKPDCVPPKRLLEDGVNEARFVRKDTYVYTNNKTVDPAKPSLVFIHGAGFDHSVWTLFARHFSRHDWNVIALDLPGHGRSEGPVLESIEAMASWTMELIETLGLDSVALVGHSMGSLITLETASDWVIALRTLY